MADTFYAKKGATYPNLITTLSNESGVIDLTDATVQMKIRKEGSETTVTKTAEVLDQSEPSNLGMVEVEDVTKNGETELEAGNYNVEFWITFQDGRIAKIPTEESEYFKPVYNRMVIQASL